MKGIYKTILLELIVLWILAGCWGVPSGAGPSTSDAYGRTAGPPEEPTAARSVDDSPQLLTPAVASSAPGVSATSTPANHRSTISLSDLDPGNYILYSTADQRTANSYLGVVSEDGAFQGKVSQYHSEWAQISPDNSLLAFVYPASLTEPYLLETQTNEIIPVSLPGYFCSHPSWSPDSQLIALTCIAETDRQSDDIYVMDLQGHSLTRLTSCTTEAFMCTDPTWSPDGRWIAYHRAIGGAGISNQVGLYLLDTSCISNPSTCTDMEVITHDVSSPLAWSPDGKYLGGISYKTSPSGDSQQIIRIYEITQDEIQPYRDIDVPTEWVDSLAWSPDGEWLAYSDSNSIYLVSLQNHESKPILTDDHVVVLSWFTIPSSP